jgi:hypothetical protein
MTLREKGVAIMNIYKSYNALAFKYKDDAMASSALEEAYKVFTIHLEQLLKQLQIRDLRGHLDVQPESGRLVHATSSHRNEVKAPSPIKGDTP